MYGGGVGDGLDCGLHQRLRLSCGLVNNSILAYRRVNWVLLHTRRVRGGCDLIERAVWPLLVVFLSPAFDDQPSFSNGQEGPAIQAAVAEHAVE